MISLIKWLLKTALLLAVLVLVAGGYLYYRYALGKLDRPEGTVVSTHFCRPTASLSGTSPLPLTLEVYQKQKGHNWLAGPSSIGLVSRRLEYSHSTAEWKLDEAFAERQRGEVAERKKQAERAIGDLINDLRSEDAVVREIAGKELQVRTGETQGYRYDAPEEERLRAVAAWQRWWADDANKAKYQARQVLDGADKAIDVLRRALGGDSAESEER